MYVTRNHEIHQTHEGEGTREAADGAGRGVEKDQGPMNKAGKEGPRMTRIGANDESGMATKRRKKTQKGIGTRRGAPHAQ